MDRPVQQLPDNRLGGRIPGQGVQVALYDSSGGFFTHEKKPSTEGGAALVGIAGLTFAPAGAAAPPGGTTAAVEFTPDGKMKRPEGYREWIYIGTPLTPNDMNGGDAPFPEFHAVYIDRESFAHFKKTGEFRDGTVLVKDLVSVGSKEAPSGKGYFEGDFNGMDVSIKDSKRFKDEPGNWAYFTFGHKPPLKADS